MKSGGWELPFNPPPDVVTKAAQVRLILLDVDGVMTDGALYFTDSGEELKVFDVQDGHGLVLLSQSGIKIGVISARESESLQRRARELRIKHILTGRRDKLDAYQELIKQLSIAEAECCYVGDDLIDLPIMIRCGLAVAVRNANHVVKQVAHWITPSAGGHGAVREICELILHAQGRYDGCIEHYLG